MTQPKSITTQTIWSLPETQDTKKIKSSSLQTIRKHYSYSNLVDDAQTPSTNLTVLLMSRVLPKLEGFDPRSTPKTHTQTTTTQSQTVTQISNLTSYPLALSPTRAVQEATAPQWIAKARGWGFDHHEQVHALRSGFISIPMIHYNKVWLWYQYKNWLNCLPIWSPPFHYIEKVTYS